MLTDINFNDATRDAQQAPEDEGEQVFEFAAKTCKRHAVIKKIVMEFTFENGIAIPDELARKVCGLGDQGVISCAGQQGTDEGSRGDTEPGDASSAEGNRPVPQEDGRREKNTSSRKCRQRLQGAGAHGVADGQEGFQSEELL